MSRQLTFNYFELRRVIGALGMALPFVVPIGARAVFGDGLQSSISAYYHTGMQDVFVGTMWAIGFFLLSYRGEESIDDLLATGACVCAVGLAVFPTAPLVEPTRLQQAIGWVHAGFAALFFLTLAGFALCLFTRTDRKGQETPQKLIRNRVYRVCGVTILLCLALIGIVYLWFDEPLKSLKPVFWLEALAILSFGVAWFVKGEAILGDPA